MRTPNRDRALLLIWAMVLMLLSAAPYLAVGARVGAYVDYPAEYTWILPPYPQDSLSYGAWVHQAASGALLFRVKYTAIPHEPAIFQPLFLVTGWIAAALALPVQPALLLVKTLCVGAFAWCFQALAWRVHASRRRRLLALALVTFSSGLGLVAAPLGVASADVWMPEMITLWSLVWNPVFAAALAMMAAVATALLVFLGSGARAPLLGAGLLLGLLAFVHPYDVPVPGLLGVAAVALRASAERAGRAAARPGAGPWRWSRPIGDLVAFALPALPPVAIQVALTAGHPVLSAHSGAIMESPPPLAYVTALGLPLLLAAVAVVHGLRRGLAPEEKLLLAWIGITALLVYVPVWFQRRMVMGVHLPVVLLAASGLDLLVRRVAGSRRVLGGAMVVVVVAASGATHVYNAILADRSLHQEPGWYFLPRPVSEALDFLDADAADDDLVLAHPILAAHIPGRTGNTVPIGHWAQSVDAREQEAWLRFLFRSPVDGRGEERRRSLAERHVRYLVVDPWMARNWLHGRLPPWLLRDYEVAFQNGSGMVLRARRGPS